MTDRPTRALDAPSAIRMPFSRPSRHDVRHHTAEADAREAERQQAEERRQLGDEPLLAQIELDLTREHRDPIDRQAAIDVGDGNEASE
jgi:hypothetical protein